jgi:hypothetical protein
MDIIYVLYDPEKIPFTEIMRSKLKKTLISQLQNKIVIYMYVQLPCHMNDCVY